MTDIKPCIGGLMIATVQHVQIKTNTCAVADSSNVLSHNIFLIFFCVLLLWRRFLINCKYENPRAITLKSHFAKDISLMNTVYKLYQSLLHVK